MELTNNKHELFAVSYIKYKFNGTKAAIEAGYSKKTARVQASSLLTRLDIKQRVKELKEELIEQQKMSAHEVIAELSKIARRDIRGLFNDDGTLKQISELDSDTAASISSVKAVPTTGGVEAIEYKTESKTAAISLLMDYHGLKKEQPKELKITEVIEAKEPDF